MYRQAFEKGMNCFNKSSHVFAGSGRPVFRKLVGGGESKYRPYPYIHSMITTK